MNKEPTFYKPAWRMFLAAYKWCTVDSKGNVVYFYQKPDWRSDGLWHPNQGRGGYMEAGEKVAIPAGIDWRTCLWQRPD